MKEIYTDMVSPENNLQIAPPPPPKKKNYNRTFSINNFRNCENEYALGL